MKIIDKRHFLSECGKFEIALAHDGALGAAHDHLLAVKGDLVNRMIQAQKLEEEQMKKQVEDDVQEESENNE